MIESAVAWKRACRLDKALLDEYREEFPKTAATMLCHPGEDLDKVAEICDGYEAISAAQHRFTTRDIPECLVGKPQWCNSDAHRASNLERCFNYTDRPITTEQELVEYILSGEQPTHYCIPQI